jgi:hypothetical protein
MKNNFAWAVGLVAIFAAAVVAIAAPSPKLQDFVGTWTASFQGKVFQTVKLEAKSPGMSGTISRGSLTADEHGNITGAKSLEGEDAIKGARVVGDHLEFSATDPDGDANHWQLKLTGPNRGELSIVGDDGQGMLKPIVVERTAAKAATK